MSLSDGILVDKQSKVWGKWEVETAKVSLDFGSDFRKIAHRALFKSRQ